MILERFCKVLGVVQRHRKPRSSVCESRMIPGNIHRSVYSMSAAVYSIRVFDRAAEVVPKMGLGIDLHMLCHLFYYTKQKKSSVRLYTQQPTTIFGDNMQALYDNIYTFMTSFTHCPNGIILTASMI